MRLQVVGSVAFDTIALVDALGAPNTTTGVRELVERFGGAGGNVAMALSKLGARGVRLVSGVGPDFAGSPYERAMASGHLDTSGLTQSSRPTAHAYVFTAKGGAQSLYFFPGASVDTRPPDAPEADLAHFAAGEVSAYPEMMRACGFVTFDPGQETFHRDLSQIRACLPEVDVLFVNEHERARLLDAWQWTLDDVFAQGVDAIVESQGARGTLIHQRGEKSDRIPAVPAIALDPTGAGDAHRAGVLYALARRMPLEVGVRLGSVAASFVIEAAGPQENQPTLAACEARYRATYGDWPF